MWYQKKQSLASGGLPKHGLGVHLFYTFSSGSYSWEMCNFGVFSLPWNFPLSRYFFFFYFLIFFIMKHLEVCIAWHVDGNFMFVFNQFEECPCPGLGHLQRKRRLAFPILKWQWTNLWHWNHAALSSSTDRLLWCTFSVFSSCSSYLSLSWQFCFFTPFSAILQRSLKSL